MPKIDKQPLVSVVIPCLNRSYYLVPTIKSVLQQDYPHIECIVMDGGSTDGTVEILKSFGNQIKWVSEPDNGHADAINKGWQISQGEVLAWLNADDVWTMPNAVGQVVAYLQEHPDTDVVYGDCGAIDANGNLVGMSYLHQWDLEYAVEYCDHCIPQPAAFIRRHILEKVGWLDTTFYQKKDHELWLRIGLIGRIQYIPTLLAHARRVEGLSQDGVTVASACLQVTNKFYSLPNLPPQLVRKKRRALSNSYLRGIDYAFAGGCHWKIIFSYILYAILIDPSNIYSVLNRFKSLIVGAKKCSQSRWVSLSAGFLSLPVQVFRIVKVLKRRLSPPRIPNLLGDRDIEWSWIAAQLPQGPGEALDFGSGNSYLALMAAQKGFNVTAVDLRGVQWPYYHHKLHFVRGDILKLPLPQDYFDLIINCSSVEHVGLAGRYDVTEGRTNGDLETMARLWKLLKPEGVMLLTIPVGHDAVFAPLCRVYGTHRLPLLINGYKIDEEIYWIKDNENRWILCDKETALNFEASMGSWNPLRNVCALGCFVLRRGEFNKYDI